MDLSPRAAIAEDAAVNMLQNASGAYSSILQGWDVPHGVDWDFVADKMPAHPDL